MTGYNIDDWLPYDECEEISINLLFPDIDNFKIVNKSIYKYIKSRTYHRLYVRSLIGNNFDDFYSIDVLQLAFKQKDWDTMKKVLIRNIDKYSKETDNQDIIDRLTISLKHCDYMLILESTSKRRGNLC